MKSIFEAVRTIQTPIQAVVFLAAIGLVALSRWRYRRFSLLLKDLEKVPEADRAKTLGQVLGEPHPPKFTAEGFLVYKRQQYLVALAFTIVISSVIVLLFTGAIVSGQQISVGTNRGTLIINNGGKTPPSSHQ